MILIGKKLSPTVSFILYDEENGKISQVGNDETISMILSKKYPTQSLKTRSSK